MPSASSRLRATARRGRAAARSLLRRASCRRGDGRGRAPPWPRRRRRSTADRAAAAAASRAAERRQQRETAAVDDAREAERRLARLKAEAEALAQHPGAARRRPTAEGPALLSLLEVPPGFEAAIAALFDGELSAPAAAAAEEPATGQRRGLGRAGAARLPPRCPQGAEPLAGEIGAPPALARRLAQTGWVASDGGWLAPAAALAAGQSLVDRDGQSVALGRVHPTRTGFGGDRRAAAPAQPSRRARRRDRGCERPSRAAPPNSPLLPGPSATQRQSPSATPSPRQSAAEERLARARATEAELARSGLSAETRLAAVAETIDKLTAELAELGEQTAETERALALLPDPGAGPHRARRGARPGRGGAPPRQRSARLARPAGRDAEAREQRLGAIGAEEEAWRKRRDGGAAQRAILCERQDALAAEIAELAARPAAIAGETEALAASAAAAAAGQRAAEDALASGETRLRQAAEAARRAEAAVAERASSVPASGRAARPPPKVWPGCARRSPSGSIRARKTWLRRPVRAAMRMHQPR